MDSPHAATHPPPHDRSPQECVGTAPAGGEPGHVFQITRAFATICMRCGDWPYPQLIDVNTEHKHSQTYISQPETLYFLYEAPGG